MARSKCSPEHYFEEGYCISSHPGVANHDIYAHANGCKVGYYTGGPIFPNHDAIDSTCDGSNIATAKADNKCYVEVAFI